MRCVGITKKAKQCHWPAEIVVCGLGVCQYHVAWAQREYNAMLTIYHKEDDPDAKRLLGRVLQSAMNDSGRRA